MSKAQSKMKTDAKTIKLLWIGLALLGLILVIFMYWTVDAHKNMVSEIRLDRRLNGYDHTMLTFCHDHDIKPCDDESIINWNADHPEDQFEYKTFKELVNERR